MSNSCQTYFSIEASYSKFDNLGQAQGPVCGGPPYGGLLGLVLVKSATCKGSSLTSPQNHAYGGCRSLLYSRRPNCHLPGCLGREEKNFLPRSASSFASMTTLQKQEAAPQFLLICNRPNL
ncbi:unnamed protein product [Spodoptera exigua]|nr:unnamed protein product [Spodoptera exigua]